MASPACVQSSPGRYLWCSLLSLGFTPEAEISNLVGKTNVKYINLGVHMFDKPNKDAFYIVVHFLLYKLDPTRFSEAYRYCWPVFDRKADTEFRKITLAWLKDIVDENSRSGPKVLASLFLSPGGPKFIALMLHLAKHVMLQEMKTFTTDGRWAPEEAAMPASTVDMAMKRLKLTKARLLQAALAQDRLLQEDRRRGQTLGPSIQEIRAEGAKYDNLLKRQQNELYTEEDALAQKLLKVRSLWAAIDDLLSELGEERQGVACVLTPDADPCVLDGARLSLKIPRVLLEKIEQLPQQLSSGNVYEAGQLNPLCTLELLNHALPLLREERGRVAGDAPLALLRLQELQTKSGHVGRVLEELKVLRQKISREEIPEVRNASRRLELAWERRWRDVLKDKPLASFLSDDPALCFLSPMAPLSFDPAAGSSRVFSCYAAKLPTESATEEEPGQGDRQGEFGDGGPELSRQKISEEDIAEVQKASRSRTPVCPAPLVRVESPGAVVSPYCPNSSLADLLHTLSSPPRCPSPTPPPPERRARDKKTHSACKVAPTRNEAKILDWECDNLASQFAEAITTTSPTGGKGRGLTLGDLLGNLGADPFSTRKQLHRTPEGLISDVKSSWRKAVEECKVQTGTNRSPASGGDVIAAQQAPWNESYGAPRNESYGAPRGPLTFSFQGTPSAPQQHRRTSLGSPPAWGSPDKEVISPMEGLPDEDFIPNMEGLPETAFPPDAEGSPDAGSSPDAEGPPDAGGQHCSVGSAVHSTLHHLWTSLGSPPAWGFPDAEGFSLDDETLPDTVGSDSPLSLGDGDLLLSPPTTGRPTSLLDLSNDEASFLGTGTGTPLCPFTRPAVPGSAGGRPEAEAAAFPGSDSVFLLDLEALDSLTPPRREYSLPQLVTFSPMDDL